MHKTDRHILTFAAGSVNENEGLGTRVQEVRDTSSAILSFKKKPELTELGFELYYTISTVAAMLVYGSKHSLTSLVAP